MKKLFSADIYPKYKKEITELRRNGLGSMRIAKEMSARLNSNVSRHIISNVLRYVDADISRKPEIEIIDQTPNEDETELPIDDLIQSRIDASRRKIAKHRFHKRTLLLPAKPFGILVMGDPHVDNEGCDWHTLLEHVKLAQQTEGILAASVGDHLDHWIGRLARLYSESSIKASDGWRLSAWLMESLQWIAIVGGNHDAWANGPGVDPLRLLTEKTGVLCYAPDEIRIQLHWKDAPELDPIIWVIRHDAPGRSWFHPTHGPNKFNMLDGKCHIMTAGHIHQWGQLSTEQKHGRVTHAIRVRGYKRADSFAMEKGFFEQEHGESCLIIINPRSPSVGRIQTFWDLEAGCKYLNYLRSK